jgi:hypothetical protein
MFTNWSYFIYVSFIYSGFLLESEMSVSQAHSVLEDAMDDRIMADRLQENPEAVLEEYDVDDEEKEALMSGKEGRIRDILGDVMADKVAVVVIVVPFSN